MTRFGQHFKIKLLAALIGNRIDHLGDGGEMNHDGVFFGRAKAAVKIPEVHAFRQGHAALAFDVFTDLVLGGFEHTVTVFAFDVEFECFFHNNLWGIYGTGSQAPDYRRFCAGRLTV